MKKFSHKETFAGVGKLGIWFAVTRVFTLFCVVIVTRALLPSDFEVIAAVVAVQGMIARFSAVNLYAELVRSKELEAADLRTAWSYETARNLFLAGGIFLAAPYIALWLERPETVSVFRVSSMGLLIAAFNNPRLIELRRERSFGLLGALESVGPLAYGVTAVLLVQWRQDYWALVWAGLAAVLSFAIVPYFVRPWMPRFNFSWQRVKPMFKLGIVSQLASGCATLREHGLVIVLVFYGLQDELGFYNRAAAFSLALGMQFLTLIWKVSFPSFSQAEREGRSSLGIAIKYQNYLLMAGLGVGAVAIPLGYFYLPLIVGAQWVPMMPTWGYLALASALLIASSPIDAAFSASRNETKGLAVVGSMAVVQLITGLIAIGLLGLEGAGVAILVAAFIGLLLGRYLAGRLRYDDESAEAPLIVPESATTNVK